MRTAVQSCSNTFHNIYVYEMHVRLLRLPEDVDVVEYGQALQTVLKEGNFTHERVPGSEFEKREDQFRSVVNDVESEQVLPFGPRALPVTGDRRTGRRRLNGLNHACCRRCWTHLDIR